MKNIVKYLLIIATVGLSLYLLFFRYKLGLARYFDPDESIYLNLAAHISRGKLPYKDFLFVMTPLYLYILAPLYRLFTGIDYIMAGRILAFAISVLAYTSVGFLFWQVRKSWLAILAPLILIGLPMPADKFLEIRPDILAMVFFTWGLIFQLRTRQGNKLAGFLAGLFYCLAILTCQKVIIGVAIAVFFFFLQEISGSKSKKNILPVFYLAGFGIPLIIFCLWSIFTGDPKQVLYSVGRMAIETQNYNKYFHQTPRFFFFSPNVIYYGSWGYDLGIVFNHLLWILAVITCLFRIIRAVFRKNAYISRDLSVGGIFISFLLFYFYLSPLKHPQYLIPSSFFVAFFITDLLLIIRKITERRKFGVIFFAIIYLLILSQIYRAFFYTHNIKFTWTNSLHLEKIRKIWAAVPKNEYLLDLEGRTIDYPYPYYVCCYSIGQFDMAMSRPLPSLSKALEKTKTRYIHQGEINRIDALLPRDVQFIHDNYAPTMDNELWVAKNW